MALTCELCGSTDFVKDNGLFVCQGCGTKYTLQEAQRQIAAQNQAAQAQVQAQQTQDALNAVLNAVAGVANAVMSNVTQAAPALKAGGQGDRYTVMIGGHERYLFFEHNADYGNERIGRWFVEKRLAPSA